MSYASRVYRQRNAHTYDEKQHEQFFGKSHALHDGSRKGGFFQAKMSINNPGDKYEREADAVAASVVNRNQNTPVTRQKNISSIQRLTSGEEEEKLSTNDARLRKDKEIQTKREIQRMCPECEKEKGIQRISDDEKQEEETLQQKAEGSSTSSSLSGRIENSSGKGRQLPAKTLAEMNSSFGTDFSHVNIHTDQDAVQMNKELKAQAFTHGNDIYFNSGKYNTENTNGRQLLAHELTHVIQQNGEKKKVQTKVDESNFPFAGRFEETAPDEFLLWNFTVGDHRLKFEHHEAINKKIVKSVNAILKQNPNAEVDVEGLASTSGSIQKNEELSVKRANEVLKALTKGGVDGSRIKVTGSGLSKGFPETSAENMAKSRGVRIVPVLKTGLTGTSGQLPSLSAQDCSAKMFTNMSLTGGNVLIGADPERPGVRFLEAGDARANPGMSISAVAALSPVGCGTIEFVQNVRSFREIVFKDQSRDTFQTGSMVLDCDDPYQDQKIDDKTDPKLIAGSLVDSPAQPWITLSGIEEGIQTIEVRDEFKTYLLFKPKKGARQTLQVGQWTWVGQARNEKPRDLENGLLKLDSAISRVIPKEGKGVTSTELPTLSPVAQHMKWKSNSGGLSGKSLADIFLGFLNKENKKCPKK